MTEPSTVDPTTDIADPHPIDPIEWENMVIHLAFRYGARRHGIPVRDTDQYADGMHGLILAHHRHDPESHEEFRSFAFAYIRGTILHGLRRRKNAIGPAVGTKVPVVTFTDVEGGRASSVGSEDWSSFAGTIADERTGAGLPGIPGVACIEDRELADGCLAMLDERERRLVRRVVMEGWDARRAGAEERPVLGPGRVEQVVRTALKTIRRVAGEIEGLRGGTD